MPLQPRTALSTLIWVTISRAGPAEAVNGFRVPSV